MTMKTVLIIDSDLGFVFWLGRILQGAGCEVIPAKSSAEASVLLSELSTGVDLLIVDSRLAGVVDFADEAAIAAEPEDSCRDQRQGYIRRSDSTCRCYRSKTSASG